MNSRVDIAIPHANLTLDCSFCHKLNLSTISPPSNRMQMTPNVVKIQDQNLCGPESNKDCNYEGGNVRLFAQHQGRDHILPGPGQIIDKNLHRENTYDNVRGEVNNLPDLELSLILLIFLNH